MSANDRIGICKFGGAPDSCESELILGPESGSPEQFLTQLAQITAQNNAKTPIAMALTQLADDLQESTQSTKVLLITDGEDACEGNAIEEIDSIIGPQLASRIDIVSFALDDSVDRSLNLLKLICKSICHSQIKGFENVL